MDKNKKEGKPRVGITLGDYNGIGPEVIIKMLVDKRINNICTPIIYGSGKILTKYKRILGIEDFAYHQYNHNSYLNERKPNVVNCWHEAEEIEPGKVTQDAGKCAFLSIQRSTEDLRKGVIDAVVTSPINKANIQRPEFPFPGHTEYYSTKFAEGNETLMMMVGEDMKLGVYTGHIPLSSIDKYVTRERLIQKIEILYKTLKQDFSVQKPKIAVLGMNPHAGENGLLGHEEKDILSPTLSEMKKKGKLVFGPFPADGFFGTLAWKQFDAVLAMYHDQGLIPFKLLAFDNGVNYTAGLPIVRTSPDHGTAYDIAGKNLASPESMRQALYTAIDVVKNRRGQVKNQLRINPKAARHANREEREKV